MIKAIKTYYNGHWFLSTTEAKWARFFDLAGIMWTHEETGLELSDGTRYLPDFWLPEMNCFFEAKGVMQEKDRHKITQLMYDANVPVVVGFGNMEFTACDHWKLSDEEIRMAGNHWECTRGGWWPFEIGTMPPHEWTMAGGPELSALVRCRECGKMYFIGLEGDYDCPHCGHREGGRMREYDVQLYGSLPKERREWLQLDSARKEAAKFRGDGRKI